MSSSVMAQPPHHWPLRYTHSLPLSVCVVYKCEMCLISICLSLKREIDPQVYVWYVKCEMCLIRLSLKREIDSQLVAL